MSSNGENLFKALADSQRRKILAMLRKSELAAGEIASRLELTPATVSHHLAKLRSAELVRIRREGQQRIYALNVSVVEEAMMLIAQLIGTNEGKKK